MAGFQHQISIVLQVKNLDQVKQQLKNVLPREAPENVKKFGQNVKTTNQQLGQTKTRARDAASGIKSFTGAIFSSLAVIGLFNRGVGTMLRTSEEFGNLERASSSFERVVGNLGSNLEVLQTATRGTVNNLQLLKTATRAVTEGLQRNQLKSTFEAATVASRRLGLQTDQTIQTITKAITRHDESALSTLGIVLKNNKEYRVMMNQIAGLKGPAKEVLAIQMRHQFVLRQLNSLYGKTSELQSDSLEKLEKFRTSWDNLRMSLGRVAALALEPVMNILTRVNNGLTALLEWSSKSSVVSAAIKGIGTSLTLVAGFASLKAIATLGKLAFSFLEIGKYARTAMLALRLFTFTVNPIVGLAITAGAGLASLLGGFEAIAKVARIAMSSISLFMDVLDYDRQTGIAQVLKRDVDVLGRLAGPVVKVARVFTILQDSVINSINAIGNHIEREFPWMTKLFTVLPSLVNMATAGTPDYGTPITRQTQQTISTENIQSQIGTNFLPMLFDNMKNSVQTLIDTAPWNREQAQPQTVPVGNDQMTAMEAQDIEQKKLLKRIAESNESMQQTEVRKEQKEDQRRNVR